MPNEAITDEISWRAREGAPGFFDRAGVVEDPGWGDTVIEKSIREKLIGAAIGCRGNLGRIISGLERLVEPAQGAHRALAGFCKTPDQIV